jgi:5-methylthioadenosine/S-adenosylhomocysteine deaminase
VIIHGTALSDDQLERVSAAKAKLVWSPQSNLRLYGATTHIKPALELAIPLGIGADWLPSGSLSTLAELKVARHQLAAQGARADPRMLVGAVTWNGARIAGLEGKLGDLRPGMAADVVVLQRSHDEPFESVLRSDPSAVELVMIGGNVVYWRSDWMERLGSPDATEHVFAWGRQMSLDTSYSVRATQTPPPRLADIRAEILSHFMQLGPIFA